MFVLQVIPEHNKQIKKEAANAAPIIQGVMFLDTLRLKIN